MFNVLMEMTAAQKAMEALTTVVTWLTGQFATMLSTIIANPLLLLPVGIFAAGSIIGLAHRLLRG